MYILSNIIKETYIEDETFKEVLLVYSIDSEQPKLRRVSALLSAIGLNKLLIQSKPTASPVTSRRET